MPHRSLGPRGRNHSCACIPNRGRRIHRQAWDSASAPGCSPESRGRNHPCQRTPRLDRRTHWQGLDSASGLDRSSEWHGRNHACARMPSHGREEGLAIRCQKRKRFRAEARPGIQDILCRMCPLSSPRRSHSRVQNIAAEMLTFVAAKSVPTGPAVSTRSSAHQARPSAGTGCLNRESVDAEILRPRAPKITASDCR